LIRVRIKQENPHESGRLEFPATFRRAPGAEEKHFSAPAGGL